LSDGQFYSIELNLGTLTIFLDVPREYDQDKCLALLTRFKNRVQDAVSQIRAGLVPIDGKAGQFHAVGLLGFGRSLVEAKSAKSLTESYESLRRIIEADIAKLQSPKIKMSRIARIMQEYFALPQTFYLTQLRILPLDVDPRILTLILGSQLFRQNIFSVREKRRFRKFVAGQLLALNLKSRIEDLEPLANEVILKLADFSRPLRGGSIKKYLLQILKRISTKTEYETVVDANDLYEIERSKYRNKGPDYIPPDWTTTAAIPRKIPKGELSRTAASQGIHPRTLSRRYQKFCREKQSIPGRESWSKFKKTLR